MIRLAGLLIILLVACAGMVNDHNKKEKMAFTEADILDEFDRAFNGLPGKYYPTANPDDIRYHFFPDLEHGYCITAGSRFHLYADSVNWAIVFEKSGYMNRAFAAEIELVYFGNCIRYPVQKYPDRNYIANIKTVTLVDAAAFVRVENKTGEEKEKFERIGQEVKTIKVRDQFVPFDNNYLHYEKAGIKIKDRNNPRHLIGFGDLVRYWHETNPALISATDNEIRSHLPGNIPKIMTIDAFHFVSAYDKTNLPSQQETYQLMAKVLVARNPLHWKPTLTPNNSWKNWESGNL